MGRGRGSAIVLLLQPWLVTRGGSGGDARKRVEGSGGERRGSSGCVGGRGVGAAQGHGGHDDEDPHGGA